jgi:hypothetical protein
MSEIEQEPVYVPVVPDPLPVPEQLPPQPVYNPHDWRWIVGGDTSRHWSSAAGGWVDGEPSADVGYTVIDTVESLCDVLAAYGLVKPLPAVADYSAAIQAHLDATARQRQYDGILSAITYRDDPNPVFAAEAEALFAWRSAVWTAATAMLAGMGEGEPPLVADVIGALPEFTWSE